MNDATARIDAFFSTAERWREELAALRALVRDCPVVEDFKWRSPCYTVEGGNVVAIWGLKDHCALAFFKGALMQDPEGILVAPGENSRSMRTVRFTGLAEIAGMGDVLKNYVHAAIAVEKAGLKVAFEKDDLEFPEELTAKLDADAALKAAFAALTPGRRRGYVLHFSQPKQAKTRVSRIEKCAPAILEGRGLHDR